MKGILSAENMKENIIVVDIVPVKLSTEHRNTIGDERNRM